MTVTTLGDAALVLTLGTVSDAPTVERAEAIAAALRQDPPAGVSDAAAAFATVTVCYDIARVPDFAALCATLAARADRLVAGAPAAGRVVEIPVCYAAEFAPDLPEVAAHAGISPEAAVTLHHGADYFVQAIGFAPGFAYLAGLPEKIHTPRRATPRPLVAAGSVGIGGGQTGVYPLATPGGWNVIGRTPLRLFDPARTPAAWLRPGDRVKFLDISRGEFSTWK